MLKLMRRNKKVGQVLLVCFGILLMVSFLVPELIRNLGGDPYTRKIYTLGGRTVTVGDSASAAQRLNLLSSNDGANIPLTANLGIKKDGEHWLLLTEEARRAGLVGPDASGEAMIDQLVARDMREVYTLLQQGRINPEDFSKPEQVERFQAFRRNHYTRMFRSGERGSHGARHVTLARALAEFQGFMRLRSLHNEAARPSQQRLLAEAKRLVRSATLNTVIVEVDPAKIDAMPGPSEESLVELFNRNRSFAAGEGPDGFGYRRPDQVQLKTFTFLRSSIEPHIPVDPVEVQKRLLRDPAAPAMTDAQRRAAVETALRKEILDRALREAALAVKGEVMKELAKIPEQNGRRIIPADFSTRVDIARLASVAAEKIHSVTGASTPAPSINGGEAWLSQTEVGTQNLVGPMFLRRGTGRTPLSALAFKLAEFGAADTNTLVQVGVPFPDAIEDAFGNMGFFVVTGARQAAEPASLDEVRAQVVRDRKAMDAYQALTTNADAWRIVMAEIGPSEVVTAATNKSYLAKPVDGVVVQGRAVRSTRDQRLNTPDLPAEVARRLDQLDPTVAFDASNVDRRTFALPLPKSRALAICQIMYYDPVTLEDFREAAARLDSDLAGVSLSPDYDTPAPDAFTPEKVAARLHAEGLTIGGENPDASDGKGKAPAGNGKPATPPAAAPGSSPAPAAPGK